MSDSNKPILETALSREEREAAALRANLKKRKEQQRAWAREGLCGCGGTGSALPAGEREGEG